MEAQLQKIMKRKRRSITKKKKKRNTIHRDNIFPLLLAAVCSKSDVAIPLIEKCLNDLFLNLPHLQLSPILSLLPSLLRFNYAEIACKSAEIVGAASLSSLEMNEMIAEEDETVKGLISLLTSPKREISMAACNAVLDLATTSVGRQQLLEFAAIENIILCFVKESESPAAKVCLLTDMTLLEEDEYPILLLQCAISLINYCTVEQLQHIPTELSGKFSLLLKRLWGQAYRRKLCSSSSRFDQKNEFCISNIRTNNLVECIFRLSINGGLHQQTLDSEHVKRSIFDSGEVDIERFLLHIWETSPMLIRNPPKASLKHDGIFGPFIQYLGSKEAVPSFLTSILKNTISCPSISSDEIDISHVINEIKNHIGHPIIYHQDIRVVKTRGIERELHYFQEQCDLSIDEILKCEEAFNEGYSIALRGLEFRYQSIAAIADGLASLFGQPSAGVNMYLTPANSQGLARHSDDHCVFVCQIIGVKRWKVFPRPDFQLPRLYEPCDSWHDLENKSRKSDGGECQEFLLEEGDVLYIPRGSPHEAVTDVNAGFSLHLTLAVEIEPPFEWEGFMQIALYCWGTKQKDIQDTSGDSVLYNLRLLSVRLLHIAIKLIGNTNPEFRKASLVGSKLLCSDAGDRFYENQKTTFHCLFNKITNESKFSDAVEYLEAALQKNEDPLEHIRWMKHLNVEEEKEREKSSSSNISLADPFIQHRDIAEATFMEVKSKFCSEVEFQNVERYYQVMLEKYKKVRKQYTNGMLSLHSALHN
ncbi:hypothetical protein ABFS82_11G023800 [Erythranthe guttata]|uniref:uncharacterized protein LOC105976577 n=1 Tax=Erythranthe guttata TaxID=4155 RepID=UPI00064DF30A|nr:PREDICTED: uncharacterized protein LOC105976577 [Erythranthe guttata]|eukprot:XP_012857272.1 PREDICTED: uncharacterized protein LOC105976577 [Erythranthe guttata]